MAYAGPAWRRNGRVLNVARGFSRAAFDVIDVERNRRAEQAVALCRHQEIVLQADTAEIQVLRQFSIVYEFCMPTGIFPLLDQRGDEIEARLYRQHEIFPEFATQAQSRGPELRGTPGLFVVTDVILAEIFHVMHIQAQHVPEPVRHEQRVRTGVDSLLHIAAHQLQVLETGDQGPADRPVHLLIRDSGTDQCAGMLHAGQNGLVDVTLPGREDAANRQRPGVVGGIMPVAFDPAIHEQQVPGSQLIAARWLCRISP